MKQLFESATLRLTGWYLIVLACISLLFSVLVYQIATGEVERRLTRYQDKSWVLLQPQPKVASFDSVRSNELAESKTAIIVVLLYMNLAVLTAGGCVSYWLAKRTLRPIEDAHEAQSRFVGDASHELRTPLASMTTELEVTLQDTSLSKQELRETLTSNLEEVRRLTDLTSTLLALSAGGNKKLPLQAFSLTASLNIVVERFKTTQQTITIKAPRGKLMTLGHQSSVEELLSILIDNALRHGSSDHPVMIRVTRKSNKQVVQVINHGEKINDEHLPHIFDRFYRADGARTGRNGYGLGLALARQISDLHGADLTVASSPKETVFTFSLTAISGRTTKKR